MSRMTCVAQRTVYQLDVILICRQDGDRYAVAPVQMQILGNGGLSRDVRILLTKSRHNGAASRDRGLKTVTSIKFQPFLGTIGPENAAGVV
ncbi:MAG: hypothetical protein KJO95_02855 [Gammaproteobacteria bacterium]|nr:hypothetical protein [Gammaproteobacteria bacterium]MBU2676448.1 hypothetical protein [Gammaproteobacteria bacterium]NNC57934.1 hypothetical protein [Woeseiaceae bacterium]NNL50183.1 hypothetical protein [Woeseiaceae bacterium]